MLLAPSRPHDDLSFNVVGARIIVWPMDLLCHLCVRLDTSVGTVTGVRRDRVVRVEVDVVCRLALVGQSERLES